MDEASQNPTCVHFTRPKPLYLKKEVKNNKIYRFTGYMNDLSFEVDYKTLYNLEGVDNLVSFENKLKGLLEKYYNEYRSIKNKLIQNNILNVVWERA